MTQLILATSNTIKPGAAVTGSFWAVRDSSPMPLVTALLAGQDHAGLKLKVEAADTMPFAGELAGRFLNIRTDAPVPTGLFATAPPGDWWIAVCRAGIGSFFLGIDDLACNAMLLPINEASARVLAGRLLGLWLGSAGSAHGHGAA